MPETCLAVHRDVGVFELAVKSAQGVRGLAEQGQVRFVVHGDPIGAEEGGSLNSLLAPVERTDPALVVDSLVGLLALAGAESENGVAAVEHRSTIQRPIPISPSTTTPASRIHGVKIDPIASSRLAR